MISVNLGIGEDAPVIEVGHGFTYWVWVVANLRWETGL